MPHALQQLYVDYHTLYHRISGSGLPSTTTARRHVSPMCTSTSSMMVSNLGGTTKEERKSNYGLWNLKHVVTDLNRGRREHNRLHQDNDLMRGAIRYIIISSCSFGHSHNFESKKWAPRLQTFKETGIPDN